MKTILLMTAVLFAGPVFAQGGEDPEIGQVDITDLELGGNGCPAGSVTSIVTNSTPGTNKADYFQFTFDAFTVKSGKGTKKSDQRKQCDVTFNVTYPAGKRIIFDNLQYNGYANLTHAIYASLLTKVYSPFDESPPAQSKLYLIAPFEGELELDKTNQKFKKKYKTDCTGSSMVSINTRIRIDGSADHFEGLVTMEQGSGLLTQGFKVSWEDCE